MTPGARLQAAIDLLCEIENTQRTAASVADFWSCKRRYAGSSDRRAVRSILFRILRQQARLDWWALRGGLSPSPRSRALADTVLETGKALCFDGGRFSPPALTEKEEYFVSLLSEASLEHPDQPLTVSLEIPVWLEASLKAAFKDRLTIEMAALNEAATVDLRVNTIKGSRNKAAQSLAEDGFDVAPTPLSPNGLRMLGHRRLGKTPAYIQGVVEIQDEGSQLAAILTDARPGMTVADICAGAGGKALALAAAMGGKGCVLISDADPVRLGRLAERSKRAGVHNLKKGLPAPGTADRVLLDVPCSGSGAWRRAPEARWRLTPDKLASECAAQVEILESGAALVKPGGRLIYATCSVLPEENEAQVERFLNERPEYTPLAVADIWKDVLGSPYPGDFRSPWLRLSPASSGTDGFFIAVFGRVFT